jgi:23S rRNA (guanosine2251-2'-O)-methyltransferase
MEKRNFKAIGGSNRPRPEGDSGRPEGAGRPERSGDDRRERYARGPARRYDSSGGGADKSEAWKADMVFGVRAVEETLRAGKEIERLLVLREGGAQLADIMQLATERNVSVQKVPHEKLDRLTKKNHQGVVCFISPINYVGLPNIVAGIYEKGLDPLLLIADRITDVRNFGAMARTAECAGVQGLIVPLKGSAQVGADAMKTSAGALNFLPVARENSLEQTVRYLQESGIRVIACTEKGSRDIYDCDMSGPLAIVMGSEEDGISDGLIRLADDLARIPMMGHIGSLNVSVATAICLYEAVRQRAAAASPAAAKV